MILVGLTGGLGSGKSYVARALEAKGALVVDADALAREVVEPGTAALAEIIEVFGHGVLNTDGSLNRKALAAIAFSNVIHGSGVEAAGGKNCARGIKQLGPTLAAVEPGRAIGCQVVGLKSHRARVVADGPVPFSV